MPQKTKEPQARFMYYWNLVTMLWEPFVQVFSCKKSPRHLFSILAVGTTFDWIGVIFDGNILTRYVLEVANYTDAVTTTLSIIDANSVTIYTGAAHAENANYSIPVDVELVGTYTFRLTLSAVASGVATDYLTLFTR